MPTATPSSTGTSTVSEGRRIYRKPPVLEALVDITVEPAPDLALAALAAVHEGEEEAYPQRSALMSTSLALDPTAHTVVDAAQSMRGYRIFSADKSKISQLRLDGFNFSRLTPYDRWEAWRGEAARLWEKYIATTKPRAVTRIAVRYINRVDILPRSGDRLQDYFRVRPEIPVGVPQTLGGFLMRLELHLQELEGAQIVLNLGRVDPPSPGVISVLFDLDLFFPTRMETTDPMVWNTLEKLHDLENSLFETSITDRARGLFD